MSQQTDTGVPTQPQIIFLADIRSLWMFLAVNFHLLVARIQHNPSANTTLTITLQDWCLLEIIEHASKKLILTIIFRRLGKILNSVFIVNLDSTEYIMRKSFLLLFVVDQIIVYPTIKPIFNSVIINNLHFPLSVTLLILTNVQKEHS